MELNKMIYKIEENANYIRILGQQFVKKNKNKGKLIIRNKKLFLNDIISLEDFTNINKIKIFMILNEPITDKSCMFKDCLTLESFEQLSLNNYSELLQKKANITEIEELFDTPFINCCKTGSEEPSYFSESDIGSFSEIKAEYK